MSKEQPYILIVDDEKDICDLVSDILQDEGYDVGVAYNGEEAKALKAERTPDLILLDIWMPDIDGISLLQMWREEENFCPVIMMSGHGTLEHAIEATKLGASDFLEKPLTLAKLLMVVEKTLEDASTPPTITATPKELKPEYEIPTPFEPVGRSELMATLRENLQSAAKAEGNILLLADAGSETSGLASYIHSLSERSKMPFVELSLGNLSSTDLESLLGDKSERYQLLNQVRGGFLHLRDIDKTDSAAQQFIYTLLDTPTYLDPESGEIDQPDVRFIFSGERELFQRVKNGKFSAELWHLINVLTIQIPALSEHPEDVPELISYYVHHFVDVKHLTYRHFSIAAQNRLRNHDWHGNYLELRNLIQRLLVLGKSDEVSLDEVNAELEEGKLLQEEENQEIGQLSLELPLREAREQFERAYLIAQYKRSEGNIANLAERVGMERTNLYRKLKSLDIDPKKGY